MNVKGSVASSLWRSTPLLPHSHSLSPALFPPTQALASKHTSVLSVPTQATTLDHHSHGPEIPLGGDFHKGRWRRFQLPSRDDIVVRGMDTVPRKIGMYRLFLHS